LHPLNVGAELVQHRIGFLRRLTHLVALERANTRHVAFDHKTFHRNLLQEWSKEFAH
jgi:hypothetical protein